MVTAPNLAMSPWNTLAGAVRMPSASLDACEPSAAVPVSTAEQQA
jgi:hypothetical protein